MDAGIKYVSEFGYDLVQGNKRDAGFDIHSSEEVELAPGEHKAVSTGIYLEMAPYLYVKVESRSGLAVKHGITVLCGIIDSDYRGEVRVVLINHGKNAVKLEKGSRVAQLVPHVRPTITIAKVEHINRMTERGAQGFGSTGIEAKQGPEVIDTVDDGYGAAKGEK